MATSPDRRSEPECARTLFLEELLDDEERGRLASLEHYVARFPQVADFVRAEYSALGPGGAPAAEAGVPARVGRYTIRGVLGEGGMGRVYEAFDPELRRRVVVKSLREELAEKGQAGERLRREARVLGQLLHPNLTRVLDLVEDGGQCHLVLAFHEGRTLGELLRLAREHSEAGQVAARWLPIGTTGGEVPPAEALRRVVSFFVRTAEALASAHAAGIVHRDLKPQNLMVTAEGAPVVLDFGLALPTQDERLTVAGELLGTPLYMAPEQIEGGAVDARTDVYALGVTLYEALTLVHPFAGSGGRAASFHRILRGDPVPPRRHRPEVPRDLEAVVLRAMERTPARRYPDMRALARELQRVLDLEPTEARPVSGFGLVWRRVQRRPWAVALSVLTAASVLVAAWFGARFYGLYDAVARASAEDPDHVGLSRIVTNHRSADDGEDAVMALQALYPVGRVLPPRSVQWIALPVRGTKGAVDEAFRYSYVYRVRLFEGERELAAEDVCSGDSRRCRWLVPQDVQLVPDREYRWSVAIVRANPVEVDPAAVLSEGSRQLLAELRSLSVSEEEWRTNAPPIDCRFTIALEVPAGLATATAVEQLELLRRHGLWADLLQRLDGEEPVDSDLISNERRLQLLAQAFEAIGDRARLARVRAMLDRNLLDGR